MARNRSRTRHKGKRPCHCHEWGCKKRATHARWCEYHYNQMKERDAKHRESLPPWDTTV